MPLADALFEHLLSAFPPDHPYGRAAIERSPMPPPVAHFVAQSLARRLEMEVGRLREAQSEWFDYDAAAVAERFEAMAVALGEHARVPAPEWEPLLRQATDRVTAYLIDPVGTLGPFVYPRDEERLPAYTVHRRMGYFSAYPYLHKAVRRYLEQEEIREIDRDRFASLLRHIEREKARTLDADGWARHLDPLFALARTLPHTDGVPAEALAAALRARGADELAARAASSAPDPVDAYALRRLIEPRPAPAPVEPVAPPAPEPVAVQAAPATPEGPVPLWKQYQQGKPGKPAPPPARPNPPSPAPPAAPSPRRAPERREAPTSDDPSVPLWMRFRRGGPATAEDQPPDAADPATANSATDGLDGLERETLGPEAAVEREAFIRHLFGGSREAYHQALERLRRAPSWPVASQIIANEVFRKHHVNIYSEPAIAFTNAVEAGFRR